jgi:dTDP-4-amino-4,6-dideoxygalactose transaminase
VKVPFIDLTRQIRLLRREIDAAIARVVDSGRFILGPEGEALEREAAEAIGARHAIAISSGTDALVLALRASGVQPGDVVLTSPFSFFATAAAILEVGARPAFADIELSTFNMDTEAAADRLSGAAGRKVRAVIPVHLYGLMADLSALRRAADRRGVPIVEDACQAIGAARGGVRAGTGGRAAGFSFFPTKNLGAFGDAGLATTNDDAVAMAIRQLRNHGAQAKNLHGRVGRNARLDEIQAAVLRVKLPRLEAWNQRRQALARRYDEGLRGVPGIACPQVPADAEHIYHQYSIRVAAGRRDALREFLQDRGIGTDVYYPIPIHLQPALKGMGFRKGVCPVAERCAREALSLPIFPELTDEEQETVVDGIRRFAGAPRAAAARSTR